MLPVYFDSSVFLAVLAKQPEALRVRNLLEELKAEKVRIYTSILAIQEVSVASFRHGNPYADHYVRVSRMARVKGVTKDIALTAAKFEAAVIDAAKKSKPRKDQDRITENRRRKFDCFHIATAVVLNGSCLYAFDDDFEKRCRLLDLHLTVKEPDPKILRLPFQGSGTALGIPASE
jgi:predicted nucleic acid-binding protein